MPTLHIAHCGGWAEIWVFGFSANKIIELKNNR